MKVTKVQKALDILTFYCRHNLSLEKPYDWPQPCEQANSLRRQDRRPLSRKAAVKVRKPMISTKIVNCLCQLVNDGAVAVHSWLDLRRTIRRNSVELQNRVFKIVQSADLPKLHSIGRLCMERIQRIQVAFIAVQIAGPTSHTPRFPLASPPHVVTSGQAIQPGSPYTPMPTAWELGRTKSEYTVIRCNTVIPEVRSAVGSEPNRSLLALRILLYSFASSLPRSTFARFFSIAHIMLVPSNAYQCEWFSLVGMPFLCSKLNIPVQSISYNLFSPSFSKALLCACCPLCTRPRYSRLADNKTMSTMLLWVRRWWLSCSKLHWAQRPGPMD